MLQLTQPRRIQVPIAIAGGPVVSPGRVCRRDN